MSRLKRDLSWPSRISRISTWRSKHVWVQKAAHLTYSIYTNIYIYIYVYIYIYITLADFEDFHFRFNDHFESHLFRNGLCFLCALPFSLLCTSYDSFHWKCYTPKIHQTERLRFLGISRYKFKLRWCSNLNLYRGIWVSGSGGFRGCNICTSQHIWQFHIWQFPVWRSTQEWTSQHIWQIPVQMLGVEVKKW